jgi:IclR family acetate operon transcriptional repressor
MQPIVRALNILELLAGKQAGLTLGELAAELDLPVSTAHRICKVLVDQKFIVRTPVGKRYLLGPSVRSLVAGTNGAFVRQVGDAYLDELNKTTEETTFLSEVVGGEVVAFSVRDGFRPMRFSVQPGGSLSLHAAAAARAILAWLPDTVRSSMLDGHEYARWTPRTISTPSALYRHLDETRARGYDICDDELDSRVWAVGAPIFDLTGTVRASITVVAPLDSVVSTERREFITQHTVASAREISTELGYSDS